MNDFDDAAISAALEERAGSSPIGIDTAFATVTGRVAATRRRRAAVAGMGALTGVVAVAALALTSATPDVVQTPSDSSSGSSVTTTGSAPATAVTTEPATSPPTTTVRTTDAPTSSTAPATVATPTTTVGGTPASTAPSGSTATTTPSGTGGGSTPATTGGTTPPGSSSPPSTAPASTSPTTSPATSEPESDPATPPFSGRTYSSAGGSITVSWNGQALSLDGTSPAPGFTASIEDQGSDRIRVRFDGPQRWQIEVRADSNGVVTSSITS